ncbi:hypothetical protein FHS18_002091 [Paenibacillus phyllosphaerae]|uniref:DUF2536 domain-containing protein n=1 Tax=Paenibacillus phyllosphaerae TaxID=274593 RepID=A0A7W5AWC6_9BACL|nr:DUF2536 family protein [Paenibacillus phyllosphaerae]MBB3110028.1 hypothetical protein [Paenibacillus phyllosphaerae]
MDFMLERLENKVEFFQAYDLPTLEKQIAAQIDNNKAMLLDVYSVTHQVIFDPRAEKMLYSAVVHFKAK